MLDLPAIGQRPLDGLSDEEMAELFAELDRELDEILKRRERALAPRWFPFDSSV